MGAAVAENRDRGCQSWCFETARLCICSCLRNMLFHKVFSALNHCLRDTEQCGHVAPKTGDFFTNRLGSKICDDVHYLPENFVASDV